MTPEDSKEKAYDPIPETPDDKRGKVLKGRAKELSHKEPNAEQHKKRRLTFWERWMPTIMVGLFALLLMGYNYLFMQTLWLYSLTMVLSCTLVGPLAVLWGRKVPITTIQMMLNLLATFFVILVLSFLFMVLPEMLGQVPMR